MISMLKFKFKFKSWFFWFNLILKKYAEFPQNKLIIYFKFYFYFSVQIFNSIFNFRLIWFDLILF